jgi:hypothetical protein
MEKATMRQNELSEANHSITEFNSQIEVLHPAQITEGISVGCSLAEKLGVLPATFNPYSAPAEFIQYANDYGQLLSSLSNSMYELTNRLSEDLSNEGEMEIYLSAQTALGHISRIERGLCLNLSEGVTADWLDPVSSFLLGCQSAENMLNHWEAAKIEHAAKIEQRKATQNPKPPKEPRKPVRNGFPLRLIPSSPSRWTLPTTAAAIIAALAFLFLCGGQSLWRALGACSILALFGASIWKLASPKNLKRAAIPQTQAAK